MAKWGEGDPRWIVEERPDATNVNNWHWVEKDATNWSKEKFKELFVGLKVENDIGWCEIKELSTTEGEATANNRKGKLIFFYEWILEGNWEGKLADGQKKIKGKFEIPNLSEENEATDIVVNVSVDKETEEAVSVKEIMRVQGLRVIQEQVAKYINDLKEEYGQGIILPSKDSKPTETGKGKNKENVAKQELNKVVQSTSSRIESNDIGVRITTTTITIKETFQCTAADLYRALTTKEMVKAYTGSDSQIEAAVGERFVLMGGNILGDITQLVPDKKICMRWRMKSWPAEHYSNVTIDLEETKGETVLTLRQTGVPDSEMDKTKEGWKVNFWERIKQTFGFGARLF